MNIVDRVQQAHQWVADWVFTYRPTISPYLLSVHAHLMSGAAYAMGVAFQIKQGQFFWLMPFFILLVANGVWTGVTHDQKRHDAWLRSGEMGAPQLNVPRARGPVLVLTAFMIGVAASWGDIKDVFFSLTLIGATVGMFFSCCVVPTSKRKQEDIKIEAEPMLA